MVKNKKAAIRKAKARIGRLSSGCPFGISATEKAKQNKKDLEEIIKLFEKDDKWLRFSVLGKSKNLREVIQMIKQGENGGSIAKYLIENDEGIKNYYGENADRKKMYEAIKRAVYRFRDKILSMRDKVPNFIVDIYVQKYADELNEIDQLQKLVAYLMERLDMAHKLELKTGIPYQKSIYDIRLIVDILKILIEAKMELGIEIIPPQEKKDQSPVLEERVKKYKEALEQVVKENFGDLKTIENEKELKGEITRIHCRIPSLKRRNIPKN